MQCVCHISFIRNISLLSAQESLLTVLRRAERTLLRTPTSLTGGQLVAVLRPLADTPEQGVAQEAGQGQTEQTEAGPAEPPGNRNSQWWPDWRQSGRQCAADKWWCGDTRSVVILFILHKNCLFWSVKIIRSGRSAEIRDISGEEFHFEN